MSTKKENGKRLFNRMILVTMLVIVISSIGMANANAAKLTLKYTMISNAFSEAMLMAETFRNWVENRTNGDIKVTIYPATLTPSAEETFELLQSGSVDCGLLPTGHAAGFYPDFQFMQLPYLFKSLNHYRVARHSPVIAEVMNKFGEKFDFVILGLISDLNGLAVSSTKPINKFEDCKGIKIRTPQNPMYVDTYKEFGFTVTATDWGELYTSLQTGRVNANDIGVMGNYIYKLNEVVDNYAILKQMWTQQFLVFRKDAWNKLSKEQQQIVREAAEGASELGDEWVYYQEEIYIERAKKEGINVTYPDTAPFIKASEATYEKWFKKFPHWRKWYNELQEYNPETRMPEAFGK